MWLNGFLLCTWCVVLPLCTKATSTLLQEYKDRLNKYAYNYFELLNNN